VEATLDIAKALKKLIDFNSNRWKLLISYNFFILLNFSIFIFILNEKEVKKFGSRYFKMRNLWERDYRHVARPCTKAMLRVHKYVQHLQREIPSEEDKKLLSLIKSLPKPIVEAFEQRK